ncbi:MAG: hypothetical protein ABSA42_05315 [Terracidiphilus sp.]|jgi:hypothetical protein
MTALATASDFALPRLGGGWYARVERRFAKLAQRQGLVVASVGLNVIALRLAILPLSTSGCTTSPTSITRK